MPSGRMTVRMWRCPFVACMPGLAASLDQVCYCCEPFCCGFRHAVSGDGCAWKKQEPCAHVQPLLAWHC